MASGGEDVAAAIKHAWITSIEATSELRGCVMSMRAGLKNGLANSYYGRSRKLSMQSGFQRL
jgi:hypothetical protein